MTKNSRVHILHDSVPIQTDSFHFSLSHFFMFVPDAAHSISKHEHPIEHTSKLCISYCVLDIGCQSTLIACFYHFVHLKTNSTIQALPPLSAPMRGQSHPQTCLKEEVICLHFFFCFSKPAAGLSSQSTQASRRRERRIQAKPRSFQNHRNVFDLSSIDAVSLRPVPKLRIDLQKCRKKNRTNTKNLLR